DGCLTVRDRGDGGGGHGSRDPRRGVERRAGRRHPRRTGAGRTRMTASETLQTRTLAEAALAASTCVKCRLSSGRTQVVYGTGSADADLMFIGEGPGFHEDKQGAPFVGAAGQLLNTMLAEQGIA